MQGFGIETDICNDELSNYYNMENCCRCLVLTKAKVS